MDTRIWNILGNHFKGESSKEEDTLLQDWLSESSDNQQIMTDLESIWEKTGSLDTSRWAPKVDVDAEWDAFRQFRSEMDAEEVEKSIEELRTKHKFLTLPVWMYRVAAAVVLGFGLIYFINYSGGILDDREMIVHKSFEQKRKIILPDESIVWLNRQSQISYSEDFGQSHRNMTLNGEAFFDVQKKTTPFVIKSHETTTEVLGTAFNLRSYKEEGQTELALIRGKVSFSDNKNPENRVILNPGEQAELKHGSQKIKKSKILDLNVTSWKSGALTFDNAPLGEVASTLEKYFNIQIKMSTKDLNACRFTGSFENPELSELLDILCASLRLTYTKSQNIITLSGDGCTAD